jgi:glycosyltransferase involved in cell wall biosynthesis
MADVTVFSVYHNRERFVRTSVASVLAQTLPGIAIVLVDDGSTDATLRELEAFASDPRVRVVAGANQGLTAALRAAIETHAHGRFVAIHGSGDWSHPERLERQAALLEARPELSGCGCWIENVDETGEGAVWHTRSAPVGFAELARRNWFSHGEVMFRRDAYEACGGYRPAFRFAQDYDLWLRLVARGAMGFVPEVLYRRVKRSDGIAASVEKRVAQSFYMEAALAQARMRRRCGRDCVDLFGATGVGMPVRGPREGRRLLLQARAAEAEGRTREFELLCDLAVSQSRGLQRWLARAFRGSRTLRRAVVGIDRVNCRWKTSAEERAARP